MEVLFLIWVTTHMFIQDKNLFVVHIAVT